MEIGIIGAVAFLFFLMWKLLGKGFGKIQKGIRRFFLFSMMILIIPPYFQLSSKLKDILIEHFNLNYLAGELMVDFKGTDWADGLLTATFFFGYIAIVGWLWSIEKKGSKPEDKDKPFKIEARIGNIERP